MTASTETAAPDLTIDVSAALPFGSEHNAVAADVHLPEGRRARSSFAGLAAPTAAPTGTFTSRVVRATASPST
jgi:hypothetical protein